MATVTPQIPDKAKEVQIDAAVANSVPQLRSQVVKLAEEIAEMKVLMVRLVSVRRKP